jgi:hypothetical protein
MHTVPCRHIFPNYDKPQQDQKKSSENPLFQDPVLASAANELFLPKIKRVKA